MPDVPRTYLDRIDRLLAQRPRVMLGLAGAPGSGKSTLAQALRQAFDAVSIVVPMDGFHLANSELKRLGLANRKGSPPSFDAAGYVALLARIRHQGPDETIYAPEFRREIEEPIAGAIAIEAASRLVITEGNYLLLDRGYWAEVTGLLDETWYVDLDPAIRLERLVQRHMHFGRTRQAAEDWVSSNDELNAQLIEATRARAGLVFVW